MNGIPLWNKDEENRFFGKTLEIATPEQLFYLTQDGQYLAYWLKSYKGKKTTLQSRNTFIGSYTEKRVKELLQPIAEDLGLYSIHNVTCEALGLDNKSPADVAITRTASNIQNPENILLIVEVKMSIVWNWEYIPVTGEIKCIGDYTSHTGNPGLLRSDTMLKAIGKSINIRVSGLGSARIPIIIMGNTPITEHYYGKVDYLKRAGIIQGFYSINPAPLDRESVKNMKHTLKKGFLRIDDFGELKNEIVNLLQEQREYFSGMMSKTELGKFIEFANVEKTYEKKAEKFLELIRGDKIG